MEKPQFEHFILVLNQKCHLTISLLTDGAKRLLWAESPWSDGGNKSGVTLCIAKETHPQPELRANRGSRKTKSKM